MHLNGWQRIWVVFAALGLLIVAISTGVDATSEPYFNPDVERVFRDESSRCIPKLPEGPGSIESKVKAQRDRIFAAVVDGAFKEIDHRHPCYALWREWQGSFWPVLGIDEYRERVLERHRERAFGTAKTGLIWWAAIMASVYALGAAIGWIWRGFFPRKST